MLFISIIGLPMESSVEGQFQQSASILQGKKETIFSCRASTCSSSRKHFSLGIGHLKILAIPLVFLALVAGALAMAC